MRDASGNGCHRKAAPLWAAFIDLLFPPQCAACHVPCDPSPGAPHLCPSCSVALQVDRNLRCPTCALRCSEADTPLGNCSHCRSRNLLFHAARTVGGYEHTLRRAVLRAKHAVHAPLAKALGERLALAIDMHPLPQRPDLVVPVPMHWLRRLVRKTNPAGTIAEALAQELRLRCDPGILICRKLLRRQASLTASERRKNVRGAFYVRRADRILGQRVLLVDDVMTTAATAREAARMLLQAGAASVYVATVARSIPDF